MRVLSLGRRAKVEVIEDDAGPVVRKTFAPCYQPLCQRELAAMDTLRPHVPGVPPVLSQGPNWFTVPYYETRLPHLQAQRPRPLPLPVVKDMVSVLRLVHHQGGDLVDAKPGNFLLHDDGLVLVDYEFYRPYEGDRPDFSEIYSFVGTPEDLSHGLPVGDLSYNSNWLPWTGVPLQLLLDGPEWLQHAHRAWAVTRSVTIGKHGILRAAARRARDTTRSTRRRAGRRYYTWARSHALRDLEQP